MERKHNFVEKLGKFIAGKGFYLVVLVCVAAITLSVYYLARNLTDDPAENDQPVAGSANIVVTPTPGPTATPKPSPKPTATPAPSVEPKATPTPTATPAPTPTPAATPAPLVFTWPVNGSVIAGFSVEVLSYDQTMGDWRTHSGLDIAAPLGTQVKAAAGGVVSALYEDDLMGTTVVIDHGQGVTSVYSNLGEKPTMKVGDRVTTGAIIGMVGDTAAAESGKASHVHFAMFKNNQAVDPESYLPEK